MIRLHYSLHVAVLLLCVSAGAASASRLDAAPASGAAGTPAAVAMSGQGAVAGRAFHYTNTHAVLSGHGTRLTTAGADVVATAFVRAPIRGRVYVEAVIYHGGLHAAGVSLWGDSVDALSDAAHPGRTYGVAGASVQAVSPWAVVAYANYGLPGDTKTELAALSGAAGQRIVVQLAIDAETRATWVKLSSDRSWAGGGDPVAGTGPTLTLGGTGPILLGGNSSNPVNYVEMLAPARHAGTAPVGYTPLG